MSNWNDPDLYDREYFEAAERVPFFHSIPRFMFYATIAMTYRAKRVLDVGCGPNVLKKYLEPHGVEVVGTDFSPHSKADVICSAYDLPFPDNDFDLIFSSDLLEHLEEDRVGEALNEFSRLGPRNVHQIHWAGMATEEQSRVDEPYHICLKDRIWWVNEFSKAGMYLEHEAWFLINAMPLPIHASFGHGMCHVVTFTDGTLRPNTEIPEVTECT